MSISPPSDLIVDVIRAADPERVREAAARLNAPRASEGRFGSVLATERSIVSSAASVARRNGGPSATTTQASAGTVYRDFEAMVLANFFESAMPADAALFGAGVAASVWKTVFAQEIARSVAAMGGIGIADVLARSGAAVPESFQTRFAEAHASRVVLASLGDPARGAWLGNK